MTPLLLVFDGGILPGRLGKFMYVLVIVVRLEAMLFSVSGKERSACMGSFCSESPFPLVYRQKMMC